MKYTNGAKTYFVASATVPGLSLSEWNTWVTGPSRLGAFKVIDAALPMRLSEQEAQADLDAYALAVGLKPVPTTQIT